MQVGLECGQSKKAGQLWGSCQLNVPALGCGHLRPLLVCCLPAKPHAWQAAIVPMIPVTAELPPMHFITG